MKIYYAAVAYRGTISNLLKITAENFEEAEQKLIDDYKSRGEDLISEVDGITEANGDWDYEICEAEKIQSI